MPRQSTLSSASAGDRATQAASIDALLKLLRSGPTGVSKFAKTGFPAWLERNVINMGRMHWFPQWASLDLAGARLANLVMTAVHSSRANFAGADLSKCNLSLGAFPKGNFAGAILRGAQLRELKLPGANLERADFSNAQMSRVSLRNANCRGASFVHADMSGVNLCCADLAGANLGGANLQNARYDQNTQWPDGFTPSADMQWMGPGGPPIGGQARQVATISPRRESAMAKRKQTTSTGNNVSDYFLGIEANAVKKWNRLTAAERSQVSFRGADLGGRDLTGINLNGVSADGASFAGAILTEARLTGSFNKASFANATLTRAKLIRGAFDDADFSDSQMAGADLSGSHFRGVTFINADLSGAKLADISLLGANLTGAVLANVEISGGWFNKDTLWPQGFLPPGDMKWHGAGVDPRFSGKGKKAVAADINGLMTRLHNIIDPARMKRVLDMLKKEKHQLFFEIEPTMIRGIVRSQKQTDLVYSCVLKADGVYSCATPDVEKCMGLSNEPCKHILVLVIGLARAGVFDPTTADRWMLAAKTKGPRWNKTVKNDISDSLLKYKGVEAGEVDWRPTETIPEDYYTM